MNAVVYMDTQTYKNRMLQTHTYLYDVYAYVHMDSFRRMYDSKMTVYGLFNAHAIFSFQTTFFFFVFVLQSQQKQEPTGINAYIRKMETIISQKIPLGQFIDACVSCYIYTYIRGIENPSQG